MHYGLDVYGQDINPLAVLVAKVRTGPLLPVPLRVSASQALQRAISDTSTELAVDFTYRQKWFRQDVAIDLSRLRRAIQQENELWIRRFLWVTLAETIRLTSNDRTTTYKLHMRPTHEIESRVVQPIALFSDLLKRNIIDLEKYCSELTAKGHLKDGLYCGVAQAVIADSTRSISCSRPDGVRGFDLVVTSPPYGDNKSTITYGQHSYLALQWIPFGDIGKDVDPTCLDSTLALDTASIGGRRTRNLEEQVASLRQASGTLSLTLDDLSKAPRDRVSRVAAFYTDLLMALEKITAVLRPNAYLIFTIGNRSVGGIEIQNHEILKELLEVRNVTTVAQLQRKIHNRRMPYRNQRASMMHTENIMLFRNANR